MLLRAKGRSTLSRIIKNNSKMAHFLQMSWGDVYYIESSDLVTDIYYIGNEKGQLDWIPIKTINSTTEYMMYRVHYECIKDIEDIVLQRGEAT